MPASKDPSAFRNRAHEVSRLEAFSDVIFGFAVSLLVVSLEAPKSYEELMEMMHGMLAFAFCFFIFIDVWFEHHRFFQRYALQDNVVVPLNTILLFVVLFYVYPLKYVFTLVANGITGHHARLGAGQATTLFTIYGLGFMAIFTLIGLMYLRAYRKRDELGLNEAEVIDTKESIYDNFATGAVGLLSLIVAHTPLVALSGFIYFIIAIPKTFIPQVMRRKRRLATAAMSPLPT